MTTSTAPPSSSPPRAQRAAAGGQAIEDVQDGHRRRRRGGAGLPGPAGGAGAAAREHLVTDIAGVVYEGRSEEMDQYKARYASRHADAHPAEVIDGADVFLGLSAAACSSPTWLPAMAERPLILALANPVPEIMPDAAQGGAPDAILATGRSDYPNQVNNVLCFPFIFRGALDCGATTINEAMKRAPRRGHRRAGPRRPSDIVRKAYGADLRFGPDYLIPKPFDPRLMEHRAGGGPGGHGQRRRHPADRGFRCLRPRPPARSCAPMRP
jgi:malic enzyme